MGNRAGEADVLDNLGTTYTSLDRPDQGAKYHQHVLTLTRQSGDRNLQAWAHNGLGEAAQAAYRRLRFVVYLAGQGYSTAGIARNLGIPAQVAKDAKAARPSGRAQPTP